MNSLYSGVFSISVLRTRFAQGPLRSRSGVGAAILSPFCPPDSTPPYVSKYLLCRYLFFSFLFPKASRDLADLDIGFAKLGVIRVVNLIMTVEGVGVCPKGK